MLIKDFYEKLAKDEALQKEIAEDVKSGKSMEEIMKDHGIEGSVDDLKAYAEKAVAEGKLDDSMLDQVTGGSTWVFAAVPIAGAALSIVVSVAG